jgi:hypothetical protein
MFKNMIMLPYNWFEIVKSIFHLAWNDSLLCQAKNICNFERVNKQAHKLQNN